ncbi:MAG: TetR/AcrR family transcriptional regulator, transcriptional repressor for nem operon [Actinomycetota bacterium]|jgi:TetR/AcrR family transcriptional repressor of nem operon|nr:TetR/AcrR family transcriptional regulator, transcriptional repressor for nem operon [Actinomycetota bacterium]
MTTSRRPVGSGARLTVKGARTRARIVDAAAELMALRGVTETSVEEVKKAAEVSSSQLYHYFADKSALVEAVIDRQAQMIVAAQEQVGPGTLEGLRVWRDGLIAHARHVSGAGGCPLGHLAGQLVETDENARLRLAEGFRQWATVLRRTCRELHRTGGLTADVEPDQLADTLLATLQGGLLLSQVQRDTAPLETGIDTLLTLSVTGWS